MDAITAFSTAKHNGDVDVMDMLADMFPEFRKYVPELPKT